DDRKKMGSTIVVQWTSGNEGRPQFILTREEDAGLKSARHHTYHSELAATEPDRATDDRGISSVAPMPERVAHNYDIILTGRIVVDVQCSAELRRNPKRVEEVRGDQHNGDLFGLSAVGDVVGPEAGCGDVFQRLSLTNDIKEGRVGDV